MSPLKQGLRCLLTGLLVLIALFGVRKADAAETTIRIPWSSITGDRVRLKNTNLSSGYFSEGYSPDAFNQRSTPTLRLRASLARGIAGSLEIWVGEERAGILYFDNPFIGSAECRIDWGEKWAGEFSWETSGFLGCLMDVKIGSLKRLTQPMVRVPIPTIGIGVIRGRIAWDKNNILTVPGKTYPEAVQQFLLLQVRAPREFQIVDPIFKPKELYQGQLGFYGEHRPVGRLRWVAMSETELTFELYDLPTDVPLTVEYRRQAPSKTFFVPGPANPRPDPLTLVPPTRGDPEFVVEVDVQSRFSQPLPSAAPRFDGVVLALFGSWQAPGSDGVGTSLDPAVARYRQAALSRINPNPLRGDRMRIETSPRTDTIKNTETLGSKLGNKVKKGVIR